jgi:hypothetical protein
MEAVRQQVACGPRPAGSPALAQAREKITTTLSGFGWVPELQPFSAETPYGEVAMTNIIARSPTLGQTPDRLPTSAGGLPLRHQKIQHHLLRRRQRRSLQHRSAARTCPCLALDPSLASKWNSFS